MLYSIRISFENMYGRDMLHYRYRTVTFA